MCTGRPSSKGASWPSPSSELHFRQLNLWNHIVCDDHTRAQMYQALVSLGSTPHQMQVLKAWLVYLWIPIASSFCSFCVVYVQVNLTFYSYTSYLKVLSPWIDVEWFLQKLFCTRLYLTRVNPQRQDYIERKLDQIPVWRQSLIQLWWINHELPPLSFPGPSHASESLKQD